MSGPRVLAVVPARGGSKGLPGKNVRALAGLPLIAHSLLCARRVPEITRCIVTTDDEDIAAVARSFGGDVPFLRPADLARDDTPMAPVVRHALEQVEADGDEPYDAVLLLDPTSPSRLPRQLSDAIDLLVRSPHADGVVAVSEPHFNPTWVGVRERGDRLERFFPAAAQVSRRQDAERFLRVNGSFYVWRREFVLRLERSWLDEGVHVGFEIPESQAFSIDDEFELLQLEALWAAGLVALPWTQEDGA